MKKNVQKIYTNIWYISGFITLRIFYSLLTFLFYSIIHKWVLWDENNFSLVILEIKSTSISRFNLTVMFHGKWRYHKKPCAKIVTLTSNVVLQMKTVVNVTLGEILATEQKVSWPKSEVKWNSFKNIERSCKRQLCSKQLSSEVYT